MDDLYVSNVLSTSFPMAFLNLCISFSVFPRLVLGNYESSATQNDQIDCYYRVERASDGSGNLCAPFDNTLGRRTLECFVVLRASVNQRRIKDSSARPNLPIQVEECSLNKSRRSACYEEILPELSPVAPFS